MSHSLHVACVLLGGLLLTALIAHDRNEAASRRRARLAAALACLGLLLTSYFAQGHVISGDGHSHLARTWLTLSTLRSGELPVWSNRWYMGFPAELHYGPLYYLLSAAFVALSLGKLFFGTKLFLWLLHLAAATSAYCWGLARYQDRHAAAVLCVAYSLCNYHLDALRVDGKLPMALIFVATPLLFALREQLRRQSELRARASVLAGLLAAFCFSAHAQYGAYVAAAYLATSGLSAVFSTGAERAILLRHVLEVGLIGAALSAWLLVPSLLETDYLTFSLAGASASLEACSLGSMGHHLLQMVTPTMERPPFLAGYLGIALALLALLGVARPARDEDGRRLLVYPLVLVLLGLPWPGCGQLRSDVLIFLGATVLTADGYWALAARTRFRYLPALVSLMLVLDAGEGLVKGDYKRVDSKPYRAAQRALEQSGVPGRVLSLYPHRGTFWPSPETFSADVSTPLGSVPQLSTRSLGYTLAIATHLARELLDQRQPLSAASQELLRLIGVRYVLLGKRHVLLEGPRFLPVTFAPRIKRVEPDLGLEQLGDITAAKAFASRSIPSESVLARASQMQLSATEPVAQTLLVVDDVLGEATSAAGDANATSAAGAGVRFRATALVEHHTSVSLRYTSSQPGFLRLAYSHAPLGRVEIDDRTVPFSRDALGAIVVQVPQGTHRLRWSVGISRLRAWLIALSGLTLLLVSGWLLRVRNGRRHRVAETAAG